MEAAAGAINRPLVLIGIAGAIIVEVAVYAGHYDAGPHPPKYRQLGFYVSKALLALSGGFLVHVHGVTTMPAALQIGASASAIVLALAKKEPPAGSGTS